MEELLALIASNPQMASMLLGGGMKLAQTAVGTGIGAGQIFSGMQKKKKAENLFPFQEDPEMRSYLNDINRQKKSFNTGTAFAESLKELKEQQALTQKGILSASGGSSGAAMAGLSKTQKNVGDIFGRIAEKGMEQENFLNQMYGNILGTMSQRKLELNLLKYNQSMTEAADLMKHGQSNLMAGFGFLSGGGSGQQSQNTDTTNSGMGGFSEMLGNMTPKMLGSPDMEMMAPIVAAGI